MMAISADGWRTTARVVVTGLLLLVQVAPVLAADAGKVLMASGDTRRLAVDGVRSAIAAGDLVFSGDTLLTGTESRLQWRTNDGGLFALRPNSEFSVDAYQYDAVKHSGRSFFSLAKGGFRTLTGRIGKKDHDSYRVTTPVATLGVRGTHYVVQLCLAGASTGAGCVGVVPGLYLATIAGTVLLGNSADMIQVGAAQSAFVGTLSAPPMLLRSAPGMLKDTVLPHRRGNGRPARVVASGGRGFAGRGSRLQAPQLRKLARDGGGEPI